MIHKNIQLLAWFNFCLDFRIYNAIAIIYFAQISGSYTLALWLFSLVSISSSLFEIPTGVFSDMIGRKKTLILGQIASILAVTWYALWWSFLLLAIGAILEWLSRSLFSWNNSALLYDSLKEIWEEKSFSEYEWRVNSMYQIALAISALIWSIVLLYESFQILFFLSIIPQIIGLIIASQIIEPKLHDKKISVNIFSHLSEAFSNFRKNFKLQILSIASITNNTLDASIHKFFPVLIAILWPNWAIPLAKVCSHIFATIWFRISGRLVKKFWEYKILLWDHSLNYIIGLLIIVYPTIATPLIKSITSLGFWIGSTAENSLLQKEFSDSQRATMGSFNSLAGSIAFWIWSLCLWYVADSIGIISALLFAQILSWITIFFYWFLYKKYKH